jgi:hypothetical protein
MSYVYLFKLRKVNITNVSVAAVAAAIGTGRASAGTAACRAIAWVGLASVAAGSSSFVVVGFVRSFVSA